ncbi:DUF4397 domain-containing protein [Larkinella sp.]|uniref:DUF4397 domain-containing protein n=1 Tax=Larkinella sp. TaxID=2034517 RepID=UPI003BAAF509
MKTPQNQRNPHQQAGFQKLKTLVLAVASLLFLAGCDKTDYLDINASERPPLSAYISFVNARPSNAGLQFWTFTTQVTTTPIAPNQASAYLPTVFGNVQINVTEGTNTSYKASLQFGKSATFSASGRPNGPIATYRHTVFAARNAKATADTLILFYDDLKAPAAGKAKLRFVNLSPGVGELNASLANGTALFTNVAYGRAANSALSGEALSAFSLGPFVSVEPGTVTLNFTRANGTAVGNSGALTLQVGKIYTVFTHGLAGSNPAFGAQLLEHPVVQ